MNHFKVFAYKADKLHELMIYKSLEIAHTSEILSQSFYKKKDQGRDQSSRISSFLWESLKFPSEDKNVQIFLWFQI